jgi:hypothetical protein
MQSIQEGSIHKALKIQPHKAISCGVAEKTIIVINQVDCGVDEIERLRSYITEIATDSYNSNKYCVLMCISKPETYFRLKTINGGEKVSRICGPSDLAWDKDQLELFIDLHFPGWSNDGKKELLELCSPAKCPGPIASLLSAGHRKVDDFFSLTSTDLDELKSVVQARADQWIRFLDKSQLNPTLTTTSASDDRFPAGIIPSPFLALLKLPSF